MAKKKKKWIQGAIQSPGALTEKAKAEGMTVAEYCAQLGPGAATRSKRQCALYRTLNKVRPRGRRKK